MVLMTPTPFESREDARYPDLSKRNGDLQAYANAIIDLAGRRKIPCAKLFYRTRASDGTRPPRMTDNGMRPTPAGAAEVALITIRALDLGEPKVSADDRGRWSDPAMEELRQAIVQKNRLWFDYSRPMNWAFLGGDRQFVPSSRDPKDLKARIFPGEIEKLKPLLDAADAKVDEAAKRVGKSR
jgi:hypothetical protein